MYDTYLLTVPLFTVSLNNYTFFLKNLIMESRLKIVNLLYNASTTFNVAVQYLHWNHLAMFAQAGCILYTRTLIFPIKSNEKSACVLYMRDFTVCIEQDQSLTSTREIDEYETFIAVMMNT